MQPAKHPASPAWQPMVDPVCGRVVEPVPIAYHVAHGNEDFYFCSPRCESHFKRDPTAYVQRVSVRLRPER